MRPRWLRRVRITGGTLAAVSFVVGVVLFPFVAGDPAPGTTKHVSAWIGYTAGVASFGTFLGLALLLFFVVADDWRDPQSWLRWRLRLWRETGSPFASAIEKARRPGP